MWPFLGSTGTRWLQQSLPNVLPAAEPLFLVWPENLPDPTLFLGIRPSHQEHHQVWSCGVAAFALPLFTVLRNLNRLLSPFSLYSLVPAAVSNFPLSLQLLLRRGAFPVFSPSPVSVFSLPAKVVPYLPQLLAPQIPLSVPRTC